MEARALRIILIDSNPEHLKSAESSISKSIPGTEIFATQSGSKGVELANKIDPDVILIDISMADENALEISNIIKKDKALQLTPIILIIDLETKREIRMKAIEQGIEAFIYKPIDDSIIITQLKAMAKVKERNILIKNQKEQLESLVEIRTKELKHEIAKFTLSQKELQESNERFRTYIESSPVGISVFDFNGKYTEVNPKAYNMLGYSKKEFLNTPISDTIMPEDFTKGLAGIDNIMKKGFNEGEYRVIKKNGDIMWANVVGAKLNDNSGILFSTDISERKERDRRIEYLTFHDSLTNVYNRAFFKEEMERLDFEQYLPLSYIISDINGLKLINDALGHMVGDLSLIEFAKVLKSNTRKNDVLARVGGDEFAILLPQTSSYEAEIIMSSIRLQCNKTIVAINDQKLELSVSLGYATKTEKAESLSHITKIAEDFMYSRKLLERESFHSAFFNSLKRTMFERSQETEEHAERLIDLTRMIGKNMGLDGSQLNELQLFAAMHDIGKISIDNNILTKPGKLTDDEWLDMKKHPGIGYRIAMTSSDLRPIAEYILCHHERWDGKGYPQGLTGEDIPLLSRILAVADAYDAMTSDRTYRKAMLGEHAINEIIENSGTQFDPGVVETFLKLMS